MTANISAAECSIVTVERRLTAVVKAKVPMAEIPRAERSARAELDAALSSLDVGSLGEAFTLWRPPVNGILDMEPGVLASRTFEPLGEVVPSAVPAGRAAYRLHVPQHEVADAPAMRVQEFRRVGEAP